MRVCIKAACKHEIKQMHISPYEQGNIFNHDERRTRKLLLNKKEILKLREQGNSYREIGEKFGFSKKQISKFSNYPILAPRL